MGDEDPAREPRRRPRVPMPPVLRRPRSHPIPPLLLEMEQRDLESVIGDCAVYETHARRPGRLPFREAAEEARICEGFVWVGLQQPTSEEVMHVAEAFGLPHLAVEDAILAHQRPKLEVYGDVVFAILKPVGYDDAHERVVIGEIAVFIGPHFAVTVRHGESDVLRRVRAELDSAGHEVLRHGPAVVLYRAADLAVDGYGDVSNGISVDLDQIEAQVFGGDSRDHAERIYKLKTEVMEFRRAVTPLAGPLQQLADGRVPPIGPDSAPYFRDVHDHVMRTTEEIETYDRMLTDILTAELAQVSVRQNQTAMRQNEDMRKISAWAAIALVPTAIAGIYGMNFDNMPELHTQYGYFVVLGVIGALCVTLYVLFRRNGWL